MSETSKKRVSMPDTLTLTKVSDSKIKKSSSNLALYESDNGLTITFSYDDDGYVDIDATARQTNS